jgi:hypothetical protein
MRQPRPDKPPPDAHSRNAPDCVCGIGGIGFTTLPRPSCLARCSSCGGAALPRRSVSRWVKGGLCVSSSHQRAATVTHHAQRRPSLKDYAALLREEKLDELLPRKRDEEVGFMRPWASQAP